MSPAQEYVELEERYQRALASLEHLQQERLTWAMACECTCAACERLSSEIRKASQVTSSLPQEPK